MGINKQQKSTHGGGLGSRNELSYIRWRDRIGIEVVFFVCSYSVENYKIHEIDKNRYLFFFQI